MTTIIEYEFELDGPEIAITGVAEVTYEYRPTADGRFVDSYAEIITVVVCEYRLIGSNRIVIDKQELSSNKDTAIRLGAELLHQQRDMIEDACLEDAQRVTVGT